MECWPVILGLVLSPSPACMAASEPTPWRPFFPRAGSTGPTLWFVASGLGLCAVLAKLLASRQTGDKALA